MFAILLATIAAYAMLGYVSIGGASLFQILTLSLAGVLALELLGGLPVDRRTMLRLVVPFALFMAACVLSTVNAVNIPSSWNYIRNWIGGLLFAFVTAHAVRTPRQLIQVVSVLMALTVLGATLAILQRFVSAGFSLVPLFVSSDDQYAAYFAPGTLLARPAGLGKMNFELGKDMLVGIVPALAILALARRRPILCGATIVLGTTAIAISVLRSSWLAAAAGAVLILGAAWLSSDRIKRRRAALFAVAACSVVLAVAVLATIRASTDRGYSTNLRVALTHAAGGMLDDYPLLGVGVGNFKYRYADYFPADFDVSEIDPRQELPAHNVFLEILTGAGPFALIAYLLVQLAALANCVETMLFTDDRLLSGIAAGLSGTLVSLFVEYLLHNHMFENHLWLIIGLSFAARRMAGGAGAFDQWSPSHENAC